jgi:hypothetical protein
VITTAMILGIFPNHNALVSADLLPRYMDMECLQKIFQAKSVPLIGTRRESSNRTDTFTEWFVSTLCSIFHPDIKILGQSVECLFNKIELFKLNSLVICSAHLIWT